MKKVAVLLALVLASVALVACGGSSNDNSTTTATSGGSETTNESSNAGGAAANKQVNILLTVRGLQRIISVTTDSSGKFSTVFTPLPTEAGFG